MKVIKNHDSDRQNLLTKGRALIHQRFSERAASVPTAIAVGFEGATWTYAELDARSNQLAHHLRGAGVGREVLVGLAFERSPEMVMALLAVLKAGGAYVPLDPAYPQERLRFMVEDARLAVILTQERVLPQLPTQKVPVLALDSQWEQIAALPSTPLAPSEVDAEPGSLAYVMYTSGSTGQPKGVQVLHQGLDNFASAAIRLMAVGPGSRVLQLASLSFDASMLELLMALLTGSRLQLIPKQTLLSGESLGEVLRRERITTLAIPPSLLNTVPIEDYPELASIVVGGEICPAETANRWSRRSSGTGRLFLNAYAPTEATIFVTAQRCQGNVTANPALGVLIRGAELYLIDRLGNQVGEDEEGEILLGGVCLARGYHRRPGLTAERFVPHPFSSQSGARLYRTADLGRWRTNERGERELAFVGRADTQVKVRGLRIELGEIEAALRAHPSVRDAVVLARSEGAATPGDRRLVAYVVAEEGQPNPGAAELAALVGARLPDFMVPTAWVALEAMPITPTGKADRAALPAPGAGREVLSSLFVAPSTRTEQALAALWRELLGRTEIGIDDSLFELGGHSLLAAQIVARVRGDFAVELPLGQVFETPTVRALAAAIDTLSTAGTEVTGAFLPALERMVRPSRIPLTFPQEQVWLLNRLAPDSIAYAFQFSIRWRGAFRVEVYARALAEVIRRHEVLRTEFPAVDGHPVQRVLPPFVPHTPVVDVAGLGDREGRALGLFAQAVRRPFDATRLPLLTWTHVRLGADDLWTLQVEHHFVHDGWSLATYLREVKEIYAAFAAGRPSPLAEPPVQYADFALWQRQLLASGWLDGQLAWWRQTLGDGGGEAPALLALPTDRPRPKQASHKGGILRVDLPSELYGALREFSRREGVTLFVTTLTTFLTLLYRLTGQHDLVIGSGVANRRTRESEALVGMVVNTVVLRTDFGGDPTVREALARVRRVMLGAHDHQDLPFEKLVEELAPQRDAARNPFFQVMFSFHDSPVPELDLPGVSGHLFERHNGSAKMDLNVVVKPQREMRVGRPEEAAGSTGDMTMVWEFATDLWERATIERLWSQYRQLLAAVVAQPSARLSSLPLLTAGEWAELAAWNDTALELSPESPVHRAFEAAVDRNPGHLAVAGEADRWTYGELETVANRVAHQLVSLGVGPERVAGIFLPRSPRMVAAILATLKAGGAYLPIDVETPAERVATMLRDSGARVLLTTARLREDLAPALAAAGVEGLVVLDAEGEEQVSWPSTRPEVALEPAHLAYVIYTSGSSGEPKGVMLTHAGLHNLITWHQRAYQVTPCDRATQLAGIGFDASVWELWPYLSAGASLHLPSEEVRGVPAKLLAWLTAERITLSFLPTPLAEALLEEGASRGWPSELVLRALLVGGDKLHPPTAARLPFALINHYGPTEDTVVATATEIEVPAEEMPSIGGPIANHQLFVVDRQGQVLPVGAAGELVIASASLARGYLGRPAMTAQVFVPNPFGAREAASGAGSRLYRTGDLVRRRRDGQLDFLGRIDSQVKIRGFRIELGEIEARLARLPGVAQAAVLALSGEGAAQGAEMQLVGYVVPQGESVDTVALAAALGRSLPEYMVPSMWMTLPGLPLTRNGKVDRRALPRPSLEVAPAGSFVAPRTTAEELVAGIWLEVLNLERVSVRENFFKLGGHSLVAARVVARLYDALGIEVPLSAVFESPTVEQLALAIEDLLMADMGLLEPVGESAAPAAG